MTTPYPQPAHIRFASEKQEGPGCHFLQDPVTLLPKNSVESAGSTCFVCGQHPVRKGQLAVQSGTEFLVRAPFPALSNESIGTPRGVSLGHIPCCYCY